MTEIDIGGNTVDIEKAGFCAIEDDELTAGQAENAYDFATEDEKTRKCEHCTFRCFE